MKIETSIALPEDLLAAIDQRSDRYGDRSKLIEVAVRLLLGQPDKGDLEARDLEIIARHAAELNEEAEDALAYQVAL